MSRKASQEQMEVLHELAARLLRSELEKDRTNPETGQVEDIPAALFAQVINFLKSNGISGVATPDNALGRLAAVMNLPFSSTDPADDRVN